MSYISNQIDEIYLLKAISLEEIFNANEIDEILKENCFWNMDSEEEQHTEDKKTKVFSRFQKHTMHFDKGSLVMKLITIAINNLKQTNKVIAKGLCWVKNVIQDNLVFKGDLRMLKKNEQMNIENNMDLKNIMSWIDENSTYNIQENKDKEKSDTVVSGFKSVIHDNHKYIKNNNINSKQRYSLNNTSFLSFGHSKKSTNVNSSNSNNTRELSPISDFAEGVEEVKKSKSKFKKMHTMMINDTIEDEEKKLMLQEINSKFLPKNMKSENLYKINEEAINSIDSKSFDIFKYKKDVGRDNVLSYLTYQIFFNYDLYYAINLQAMEKFVEQIRLGYKAENPYHHDIHAADVLHTCYSMIKFSNIKELLCLDFIDLSSFYIAAIIHDFRHPGLTNGFLVNTKNKLSIEYNDISVLENYHVSEAFKIIQEIKDCNIFSMLSPSEYKIMRKRIIDCVLATDMTKHAQEYHYFKMKVETYQIKNGSNVEKIFLNLDENGKNQTKQEFMNTLLHLADISNPLKPLHVYKQWAELVMNEFWLQGDKERELGFPFSFLCDRRTTKLPAAQVGFMDGIVMPLTQTVVEMFPTLYYMIENILVNSAYYKKLKEEESTLEIK